jgi:hypothetical protein
MVCSIKDTMSLLVKYQSKFVTYGDGEVDFTCCQQSNPADLSYQSTTIKTLDHFMNMMGVEWRYDKDEQADTSKVSDWNFVRDDDGAIVLRSISKETRATQLRSQEQKLQDLMTEEIASGEWFILDPYNGNDRKVCCYIGATRYDFASFQS